MASDKKKRTSDNLSIVLIPVFILLAVYMYVWAHGRISMVLDNIRGYYASSDSGLFMDEQEIILWRAFSIGFIIVFGTALLCICLLYMMYKRSAAANRVTVGKPIDKAESSAEAPNDGVPENIPALARRVTDGYAARMEEKHITYTVDLDDVEKSEAVCDGDTLCRIFTELLENAYQSVPDSGRVYAALRQFYVSDDGYGHYEFTVEDDGPAGKKHVPTDTKHLVDAMDGYVDIDEQPGVGTGVTVSFKLRVV